MTCEQELIQMNLVQFVNYLEAIVNNDDGEHVKLDTVKLDKALVVNLINSAKKELLLNKRLKEQLWKMRYNLEKAKS